MIDEDLVVEFEERAAHLEFSCGETRFAAEEQAAQEMGQPRWRFLNAIEWRDSGKERNQCTAA